MEQRKAKGFMKIVHHLSKSDLHFLLRIVCNELEARGDVDTALTCALDESHARAYKIKEYIESLE